MSNELTALYASNATESLEIKINNLKCMGFYLTKENLLELQLLINRYVEIRYGNNSK